MLSVTGRIGAVRISDGGGLAARGGHVVTQRRNPALLAGAVLACTATLAVAVLPSTTAPSNHPLASRQGSHGRSASSLPISLAPTVSASIGASERSFWPVHRGATLTAQGGGIHSTFTSAGAAVRVSGGTLALSLAAVGRGGRVSSLPAAVPTHAANQVLYRHGSIGEFYRTGPYGLEQGFSLPRRPEAGAGSLVLAIRLGGSLLPKRAGSRVLFRT